MINLKLNKNSIRDITFVPPGSYLNFPPSQKSIELSRLFQFSQESLSPIWNHPWRHFKLCISVRTMTQNSILSKTGHFTEDGILTIVSQTMYAVDNEKYYFVDTGFNSELVIIITKNSNDAVLNSCVCFTICFGKSIELDPWPLQIL